MPETTSSVPAMGSFSKFPPEIIFQILECILWSAPRPTHENICAMNMLMKTNKALRRFINEEWKATKAYKDFLVTVGSVEWYVDPNYATGVLAERGVDSSNIIPIEGPRDLGPDLITGIILDDCTDCFKWFSNMLPPTYMSCCNEGGWTFLSLALHARSEKLLEHFFIAGYPWAPGEFITSGANALISEPSHIGISASNKDPKTFAKLFTKVKVDLNGDDFRRVIRSKLTPRQRAAIRSVAPPSVQKMLSDAGLSSSMP